MYCITWGVELVFCNNCIWNVIYKKNLLKIKKKKMFLNYLAYATGYVFVLFT